MSKITPKRKAATDRQQAHGESLRIWLKDRAAAAAKARVAKREKIAKAKKKKPSRGVDRVPARYKVATPGPVALVEHDDDNYVTRRNRAERQGNPVSVGMRRPPAGQLVGRSGSNRPHVNPARDAKPGARLRKADS